MRFLLVALAVFALAGCARPTGDFGRPEPDVLHDTVMPEAGKLRAEMFGERVSELNLTDEEQRMRDLAWRFLVAPHARDWYFNILVEWQRTRLAKDSAERNMDVRRYYAFLRSEDFQSSRVRYKRVIRDIDADTATMPRVFEAICAVQEIDRRRETASRELPRTSAGVEGEVRDRHAENQAYIDWFVRSARYRYDSYTFALESLLIETPHEEARTLDGRLSEMATLTGRAERRDFCTERDRGWGADDVIPSRMLNRSFKKEPELRK